MGEPNMSNRAKRFSLVVLTAAAVLASPARADLNSTAMMVFDTDSTTPNYTLWNGSAWGTAQTMSSIGKAHQIILRNCPTRNETACVIQIHDVGVHALFFNGTTWTLPTQLTADNGVKKQRNCAVAYEQSSGDALIAYWTKPSNKIGYRTYDGSVLSAESVLTLPTADKVHYLTLTPNPKSDEIILVALNDQRQLYAVAWNGSAWGTVTTLETDATQTADGDDDGDGDDDSGEHFSVAFESQSGQALAVYGQRAQPQPRYRFWNGSGWSAESTLPSTGMEPSWSRLIPDPASNQLLFAALDSTNDINVNVWNGSAWGANLEVEIDCQDFKTRHFDLAYENGGTKALLAYAQLGQTPIRFRTWNGSAWSAEQIGPDLGQQARRIQLRTGATSGEIFITASDKGKNLEFMRWDGSTLTGPQQMTPALHGGDEYEGFMVVAPTAPAKTVILKWREVPTAP